MSSFQTTSSFPFANPDLTRSWIDLKLPSLTIATLFEAQHKNAAALASANQAAFDGLKTLVQRQGDLLKTSVDEYSKVTSELLATESFEQRATKQADATRDAYISVVARFGELSDIVFEANVTAIGIVNARIIEALGELKALFAPPVATTDATSEAPALALPEPAAVGEAAAREEVAAAETAVFPVEPDPTTVTAASTIAPEAAAPEAEAVAAPTPPPKVAEPEAEVAAAAAPMILPETAAPEPEVRASPAPRPRPKTAAPAAKAAASPARTTAPKTPPLRPPRRPTSRS